MHFLVHVGVLRDDESVQLAYEDRVVPLPDLWWQSDADSDTNTNANANSNPDTDTNPDADSNAGDSAECADQSRWRSADNKPRSLDVDRQLQ